MAFAQFVEKLEELVEKYSRQRSHLHSPAYDESSLRDDFLRPFWHALGWDLENKKEYSQLLREVQVESRIEDGGTKKRADYLFRTDGIARFVCEAKKPKVDLNRFAYQAQRYAFNLRLLVSTLTNFEFFKIYIVGGKPDKDVPWEAYKTLSFTEYLQNAQLLWDLFSRDAVASGSLDRWVASLPKKQARGKARQGWLIPLERIRTVDAEFLEYIEEKRERLAKLLVRFNSQLNWDASTLTECVQRILDRILFVRICEDRDIDTGPSLLSIGDEFENAFQPTIPLYRLLVAHFNRLDETFNGALFRKGHMSEGLAIPNSFLIDLIHELSNEDSPYLFNTLPVEILGNVYERFIAKSIRLSKAGTPHIEDKPELRKEGGIFYTPQYVVDETVEKTLGDLITNKSPSELAKLRILDPSCGSGSFLIRVFERLCLEHQRWLSKHPSAQKKTDCHVERDGTIRLTTHYKRKILLDNVYGVDNDNQAVEVTMLSLYLKILEGENKTTLGQQRALFPKETFLPDLRSNIKCGNSIIGPDFWQNKVSSADEKTAVNAFSWKAEFGCDRECFDAIVGNPPWGAHLAEEQRKYLARVHSRVVSRMIDSYIYFIDKSVQLLKSKAPLGFVIPSTVLNQVDAQPVRELLLSRGVSNLTSLGGGIFGSRVLNTTTIVVSKGRAAGATIHLSDLSKIPPIERRNHLGEARSVPFNQWKKTVSNDPHSSFLIQTAEATTFYSRLRKEHAVLQDLIAAKIQRGVSPDNVAAHILTRTEAKKQAIERELLRPSITGSQIKAYHEPVSDQQVIYTTRTTQIKRFPSARKWLAKFRPSNKCTEVRDHKHPWYSLHRPRKKELFNSPKIIGLTTTKTIELVYDGEQNLVVTDAMYVFRPKDGVSPWDLMAVMQSKLFLYLYRASNQGDGRVIPQVKAAKLHPLPIPNVAKLKSSGLAAMAQELTELNSARTSLTSERALTANEREAVALQERIERKVRQLYGITKEEEELVDESFEIAG